MNCDDTSGVAGDDEAYRQHQRDRIAWAQRHDAEQAKPKLTYGVTPSDGGQQS